MASIHFGFEKDDVSDIVLMPGDPLRAKYISDKYLTDVKLINTVRNNFGYTGYYKGKKISVIASGMGIPSMGIYAYELFSYYDVKKIIRLGTCGSMKESIKVSDLILATDAYSESSFAYLYDNNKCKKFSSSESINNAIIAASKENNIHLNIGTVFSTDVFEPYAKNNIIENLLPKDEYFLGTEMESFALFFIAKYLNKEAGCVLTVSDSPYENKMLSSLERQESLNKMIELVLNSTLYI